MLTANCHARLHINSPDWLSDALTKMDSDLRGICSNNVERVLVHPGVPEILPINAKKTEKC